MSVPFRTGWCATDLGDYRPCQYTYDLYRYEDQPPLDAADFTGEFQWYGDRGPVKAEALARLAALDRALAPSGLRLPADFITFYSHARLCEALDETSVTCCWTDLSDPIASPVEPGAWLVRFLRDQQDCVIWYLYLRPNGETFVIFSNEDFEYLRDADDTRPDGVSGPGGDSRSDDGTGSDGGDDAGDGEPDIIWCSPSFEQFAYRFWLENRAWQGVHAWEGAKLDDTARAYLRHFRPAESRDATV